MSETQTPENSPVEDGDPGDVPIDSGPQLFGYDEDGEEKYASRSCCLFSYRSRFRQFMIRVAESKMLDALSMLLVLICCVTLAMFDPLDPDCETSRCKTLGYVDQVLAVLFLVEMLIKMAGMGGFGKKSYISDPWNKLDFIIVVTGCVDLVPGSSLPGVAAFRTFRVLRPLRALNKLKSLKILIRVIIEMMPSLASVTMLLAFIVLVFGILAIQLWGGIMQRRCFNGAGEIYVKPGKNPATDAYVCTISPDKGTQGCPDSHPTCDESGMNPFWGAIHFDHIWAAFLTIFQIITLEAWVGIMFLAQESFSPVVWIYFVGLVFLGAMFGLNLMLVVVTTQFAQTRAEENSPSDVAVAQFAAAKEREEADRAYTDLQEAQQSLQDAEDRGDEAAAALLRAEVAELDVIYQRELREADLADAARAHQEKEAENAPKVEGINDVMGQGGGLINRSKGKQKKHIRRLSKEVEAKAKKRRESQALSYEQKSDRDRANSVSSTQNGGRADAVGNGSSTQNGSSTGNGSTVQLDVAVLDRAPPPATPAGADQMQDGSNTEQGAASQPCSTEQADLGTHCNSVVGSVIGASPAQLDHWVPSQTGQEMNMMCQSSFGSGSGSGSGTESGAGGSEGGSEPPADAVESLQPGCQARAEASLGEVSAESGVESRVAHGYGCVDEANRCVDERSCEQGQQPTSLEPGVTPPLRTVPASPGSPSKALLKSEDGEVILPGEQPGEDCEDCGNKEHGTEDQPPKNCIFCEIPGWEKVQRFLYGIVMHKMFDRIIVSMILGNTLVFASEHHLQPQWLIDAQTGASKVFTWVFILELVMKLPALGPKLYFSDGFNCFDCFIVSSSILEMISGGGGGLGVLRTFRILRVLKLLRFMPELMKQIQIIVKTLGSVGNFLCILGLFLFIFTVLAMQMFGGKFNFVSIDGDEYVPRRNFDTFGWALITVFQCVIMTDWSIVCYDCIRSSGPVSALYFVVLIGFGNYVLFNLLLAILIDGFCGVPDADDSEDSETSEEDRPSLGDEKQPDEFAITARSPTCDGPLPPRPEETANFMVFDFASEKSKIKGANGGAGKHDERELINSTGSITGPAKSSEGVAAGAGNGAPTGSGVGCGAGTGTTPERNTPVSIGRGQGTGHGQGMMELDALEAHVHQVEDEQHNLMLYEPQHEYDLSSQSSSRGSSPGPTDTEHPHGAMRPSNGAIIIAPPAINNPLASPPPLPAPPLEASIASRGSCPEDLLHSRGGSPDSLVDMSPTSHSEASLLPQGRNKSHIITGRDTPTPPPLGRNTPTPPPSYRSMTPGSPALATQGGLGLAPLRVPGQRPPPPALPEPLPIYPESYMAPPSLGQSLPLQGLVPPPLPLPPLLPGTPVGQDEAEGAVTQKHLSQLDADATAKEAPSDGETFGDVTGLGSEDEYRVQLHGTTPDSTTPDGEEDCIEVNGKKWEYLNNRALCCLSEDLPIRQFAIRTILNPCFDQVIIFFIILSSLFMVIERPAIEDGSPERLFLVFSGYMFTTVFFIEFMFKLVAYGFCPYIQDGWNKLDFMLVSVSVIDLTFLVFQVNGGSILSMLRILRMFRTLRPLRVINRAPGLKLVVATLIDSLVPMGCTCLLALVFFFIFGILGVQMFKGTFYHCTMSTIGNVTVVERSDCVAPAEWQNRAYNFDSLPYAMLTLFVVSMQDGWMAIMYDGIDMVGIDKQPQKDASVGYVMYFLVFLIFGAFIIMNMFVGVIVENFNKSSAGMLVAKREEEEEVAPDFSYTNNYSDFRLRMHEIAEGSTLDMFIAGVIMVNVVTMAMEFHGSSEGYKDGLLVVNYVFVVIFLVEWIVKAYAYGLCRYMKDGWAKLDTFIVIVSLLGIPIDIIGAENLPMDPTMLKVLRVLRVARILKLLKSAEGLKALLDMVLRSLPQCGNLGFLLFLLYFIFAALGVELFGRLGCEFPIPNPPVEGLIGSVCDGLSVHTNFERFDIAMLSLFRISTGDWSAILKDAMRSFPQCDDSSNCKENCCANPVLAPAFMITFLLLSTFMLLNVVVAVLMSNLEAAIAEHTEKLMQKRMKEHMEKTMVEGEKTAEKSDGACAIPTVPEVAKETVEDPTVMSKQEEPSLTEEGKAAKTPTVPEVAKETVEDPTEENTVISKKEAPSLTEEGKAANT